MRSLVGYCKLLGRTSAEVSPAGGRDLDQIVARIDRRSGNREVPSVVQLIETPQALEQRRRRAEEIAGEIENLRRVSESRYLAAEPEGPQKAGLRQTSVDDLTLLQSTLVWMSHP